MARSTFPTGSLLAAMLGDATPPDVRRAARRLRSDGAPALAIGDEIAGLARGLATTAASQSSAVLAAVPPLFWLEAPRADGAPGSEGWVVEAKPNGLAVRGFGIGEGDDAVPMPSGTMLVRFGLAATPEDDPVLYLRGLLTAVSLPDLLSQMGESSPVLLHPADAPAADAGTLRGLRLLVAIPPEDAPG